MKRPLVRWRGGEKHISTGFCVREATVDSFEERDGVMTAKGSLTTVDYIEGGASGDDKWIATGTCKSNPERYEWVVEPDPEDAFWKDDKGKFHFTPCEDASAELRKFVTTMLAVPDMLR